MPQVKINRVPPTEDDPIKHTTGGEMPDADAESRHTYQESDFEELEKIEEIQSGIPRSLVTAFFAVGFGIGLYFLLRRSSGKGHSFKEEGDEVSDEALRAMEVDEVQPSRLMGA